MHLAQVGAFVYRYLPELSALCNSEQFIAQICGSPVGTGSRRSGYGRAGARPYRKNESRERVPLSDFDWPLPPILHQELGYLDRVQCGPFQKLISTYPKRQSIVQCSVNSYPSDCAGILASGV